MPQPHFTFCRICEATCGLVVDTENNRITDIRPDPDHVVSQGYACVKGTRYAATQHSPDRVTRPLKRVGPPGSAASWVEISWRQALREIAAGIRAQIDARGPQAVGHFVGSAGGANVLAPLFRNALFEAIGSSRMYGTGTCDTMNKFRVNGDMYGSPMRLAHPDVDHTDFLMVLGANPAVSGNTLYHLPRSLERFKAIVARGGRAVFVNPRRVESARAGEHLFIRPDTDIFFLAAFCRERIRQGVDREHVARTMSGFEALERAVEPWTPERQEAVTGISAETLRDLARSHAAAGGAALYMATGVNQGRSGTHCFWLLECINAVSGNLDRAGGTLMGKGLFDMAKEVASQPLMQLRHDRADGLPTVSGQQPAGMLADDILRGDVTALIVEASNPLLACSNPDGRLDEAMSRLDLLARDPLRAPELRGLHADALHDLRRRDPRAASRRPPRVVDVRAPGRRAGRDPLRKPPRERGGKGGRAHLGHEARTPPRRAGPVDRRDAPQGRPAGAQEDGPRASPRHPAARAGGRRLPRHRARADARRPRRSRARRDPRALHEERRRALRSRALQRLTHQADR
jgi:anaerobic selenocysteine-containing dehydrogenase